MCVGGGVGVVKDKNGGAGEGGGCWDEVYVIMYG